MIEQNGESDLGSTSAWSPTTTVDRFLDDLLRGIFRTYPRCPSTGYLFPMRIDDHFNLLPPDGQLIVLAPILAEISRVRHPGLADRLAVLLRFFYELDGDVCFTISPGDGSKTRILPEDWRDALVNLQPLLDEVETQNKLSAETTPLLIGLGEQLDNAELTVDRWNGYCAKLYPANPNHPLLQALGCHASSAVVKEHCRTAVCLELTRRGYSVPSDIAKRDGSLFSGMDCYILERED